MASELNFPAFKVQVDYTGRSTTNIKAEETVNSSSIYEMFHISLHSKQLVHTKAKPSWWGHACKVSPLQIFSIN